MRACGSSPDLREGLPFEDIVPINYTQVTGSLEDLIERLGKTEVLSPRQLASVSLATGLGAGYLVPGQFAAAPVAGSRTARGRTEHHRRYIGWQCGRPRAALESAGRAR